MWRRRETIRVNARLVGHVGVNSIRRLVFDHEEVDGGDFSGRHLDQFVSIGSRFQSCRFVKMRIEGGSFGAGRETSEYLDCTFDGSRISFGPGGYTRFVRCSFRNVDLRDWFCFSVEIVDCVFTGRLQKVVFNGTVPEADRKDAGRDQNQFEGNDFSGAVLIDVDFRTGIDMERQRMPPDLSSPGA
jgi:uncharacterized protein YjbI with pentapeptide repeats